jgi:acyl dehydratase
MVETHQSVSWRISTMAEESLITDEMRAMLGKEVEPVRLEVDKTSISWFARAVGYVDLIYYDEEYAKSRGHRGIVAPPGFFGQPVYVPQGSGTMGSAPSMARLLPGMKVKRALNGGTEFEYYDEEVCAGDVLTRTMKVVDLQERTGSLGKMLILTTEASYRNAEGKLVATQRGTGIVY